MKKILLLLMILPIIGLSQNRYQWKEIKYQDNKQILKSTGDPVTGIVEGKGGWFSQLAKDFHTHTAVYKDGQPISCVAYYKNGQIEHESENNYQIGYYENGNRRIEGSVNNQGEKHGLIKYYYNDGSLEAEENYNNGSADGNYKYY